MVLLTEIFTYLQKNWTVAGVTSFCALGLTLWELRTTRRHNRLSVKPFLTDHDLSSNDNYGRTDSLELTNNGLGPALIKKFEVRNNKMPMVWRDQTDLQEQIQKMLPFGTINHIRTFNPGAAIAAGENCLLLRIFIPTKDLQKNETMKQTLLQLSLHIEYESMYGEKCPPYVRGANKALSNCT